jgi:PAS domain S-box-containing protein
LKHSRLRSAGSFGLALPLLIVLLSLVGYVVTSETIRRDRDSDAARRVEVDTVGAQVMLGRAGAYVVGLGNILAGEPVPGQQRFVQLAGGTAGGVGLLDAMWVERIPGFARSTYEARVGAPITRLTPAGSFEPAPPAASYLAATFTTNGSPELPPGVDVSRWPALATAIRDRSSASAVSASELGSLGGRPGFYLLEAGSFGRGPNSRGYLVVFVPQGWLTASTGGDPRRLAVSLDGRHLEGFDSSPARSASFGTLGRRWRIDVATAPLTGLQTLLPWLAIAWPIAAALIAVLVGRGIARRRRAEREVERIFDLSLDLLCIAGLDGHFKRVNPAFERTLGYTIEQLLSQPLLDFVHPDDRARTVDAMEMLERGEKLVQFENRYMCSDDSVRWLQWSVRPMPDEGLLYAAARDVTDRRRAADELRESQRMVEASRDELRLLADEQAALRRVATLVAGRAPPNKVFAVTAAEVCRLLGSDVTALCRYEPDATAIVLALESDVDLGIRVGTRIALEGENAIGGVFRTGRPARQESYAQTTGPIADIARKGRFDSSVGAPIMVEGSIWGVVVVSSRGTELPADTEERLGDFTELVATTIANTEARTQVNQLAAEQASLRRVATFVAKASPPAEVFTKVAEELANLLGDADCSLFRLEGDGTATAVALWGANLSSRITLGTRIPIDVDGVIASALRDGRPFRIGDYSSVAGTIAEQGRELGIRSAVGCPIVVHGRIWGAIGAARYEDEAFPRDTEPRIARFAELVGTAIANADTRAEVERLAEEQAALRRVATLVAQGASPTAVFDGVAAEMEKVLDADRVSLNRYEPGDRITVVAHRGTDAWRLPPGSLISHMDGSVVSLIRRTERPGRIEPSERTRTPADETARAVGATSAAGAPIVVDGRLWGAIVATWKGEKSAQAGTEARMAKFAQLLDTAIANADSRDQLKASRTRLVAAADEARRRVVRDLHDGVQQRLVHTIILLKQAAHALPADHDPAGSLVAEALVQGKEANDELRELAHGIMPAVLTRGGLAAGVDALVARSPVPVAVGVTKDRFPAEVEATAYFVIAEALTNVAKHANAGSAEVRASVGDGALRIEVQDDGAGGADPSGPGLVGLADRIAALDGEIEVDSLPCGGTRMTATIPLPMDPASPR